MNGAPGQTLVVHHAEPGSDTAQALSLLGSMAAESRTPNEQVNSRTDGFTPATT